MSEARSEMDGGDGGMWVVKLPDGGVRAMTLDELDQAFQADLIGADTLVLEDGSSEWKTLADLIGCAETSPELPPEPIEPHGTDASEQPVDAAQAFGPPPAQPAPSPVFTIPATPSPAPLIQSQQGPSPVPAIQYQPAPSPGPTIPPPPGPSPIAPIRLQPAPPPVLPMTAQTGGYGPLSTAPVASEISDLDLDFSELPFKKKSRRGIYVVGALMVLTGAGVFVTRQQSSDDATGTTTTNAVAAAPATPPAATTTSQPVVEAPKPAQPSGETRLSDDKKRALAEADKKREKLENERQKRLVDKRRSGPSRGKGKSAPVFTKGGDRYDPLNSGL